MSLVFILHILFPAVAAPTELSLRSYSDEHKKYETIQVVEFEGVKISKSCFKKGKPDCMAWTAVKKIIKPSASPTELLGNPAARYCGDQNSMNRIFKSSDNSEYDYCVFSDGSAIDSWTLYRKHFK